MGDSSGISRAAALAYSKKPSVYVALSYFQHKEKTQKTVRAIKSENESVMAVYMNSVTMPVFRKLQRPSNKNLE